MNRLVYELFRRLLWLIPTLLVVTALAFAVTASALSTSPQPVFFNASPVSVAARSWALAEQVGRGDEDASAAATKLNALGGAALPHILPKLDGLAPDARGRVAVALWPLAQRMGLAGELPSEERALSLWSSFWIDHFVDFHPAMVRRVVRRFVEQPTPQREREVRRLDTYAIGELIEHLDPLLDSLPERRSNLIQLTALLSHMVGNQGPAALHAEASPSVDRETAQAWQRWWNANRHLYASPVGLERVLAPVLQTQYATWARNAADTWFKAGVGGLFERFPWQRFGRTLTLFLSALVGGGLLGTCIGTWATSLAPAWARRSESVIGLSWLGIPPAALSAALAWGTNASMIAAAAVSLLTGAAIAARYQSSHARMSAQWMASSANRPTGREAFRHLWRRSSPTAVWALSTHASSLLATVIVVEAAFGIEGLGALAILALQEGSVEAVLLTALLTTTFVSLIPILGLILSRKLNPHASLQPPEPSRG